LAPRLDALAKDTKYAVLKIDIAQWQSPVASQYKIRSVPFLQAYDASGKLIAEGKEAYKYIK
jgi:hypothetical protein